MWPNQERLRSSGKEWKNRGPSSPTLGTGEITERKHRRRHLDPCHILASDCFPLRTSASRRSRQPYEKAPCASGFDLTQMQGERKPPRDEAAFPFDCLFPKLHVDSGAADRQINTPRSRVDDYAHIVLVLHGDARVTASEGDIRVD